MGCLCDGTKSMTKKMPEGSAAGKPIKDGRSVDFSSARPGFIGCGVERLSVKSFQVKRNRKLYILSFFRVHTGMNNI